MPSEALVFGNQQATGDQPLAGAPEVAYNVVTDASGAVRRRPGIVAWEDAPDFDDYQDTLFYAFINDISVQGITVFNGHPVWVAGKTTIVPGKDLSHWWTVDDYGVLQEISANTTATLVKGYERPMFAETQFQTYVVAGDSSTGLVATSYDGTTAASWGPSGAVCTQVVALAQRLLVNNSASTTTANRVLFSGTGATGNTTFGALGFTSAEARPDAVVALRENSNELFVFGERTLQVFVPDPQVTLSPQRTINRGCAAAYSVVQANEHYGWLDDERQIVVSDGRDIDTPSDPIAATLDSIETVDDCYGFRVNADQFDLMCWQFPTDERTFCYQRGGGWSQWSTWDAVGQGHDLFGITSHYYWSAENRHLIGREDGTIAQLSTAAYTDLGVPIVAEVTTGFLNHGTDAMKFTDALHLTFKRGQTATGSTEPLILLSWRDAQGAAFNSPRQIGLGTTGDYVSTVTLRSLGGYRRRQWKLLFSHDAELVLASVMEDFFNRGFVMPINAGTGGPNSIFEQRYPTGPGGQLETVQERIAREQREGTRKVTWDAGAGLKGAAGGALAGGMATGSPWGALAGAVGGGFLGGKAGAEQVNADSTRQAAMAQAVSGQAGNSRDMQAQRQQDLDRTMALYGPALQSLEHLYGIPMSAWGQALPQNRQGPPPPRTGMVGGMPATAAPMRPEFAGMRQPLQPGPKPLQGLQSAQMRPGLEQFYGRRL